MRERMFELVERAEEGDTVGYVYDIFIAVVAVLSITPVLFRTGALQGPSAMIVDKIDVITVYILLFDYLMRWMTHDMRLKEHGLGFGWKAFLTYPFTPLAIIDIVSLLPTLIIMPEAFRFLRLLRLFKLFRVLRSLSIIAGVFVREARTLISVLIVILLYVLSTALVMYSFEPDTFPTLLDAFYWASTAMATIGYGDLCPQTSGGKIVSILSTILGIVVVSLPAGIITGGYVAEMRRLREKGKRRHRALDVDTGFDERLVTGVRGARRAFRKRRIWRYFLSHPRVVYYLVVMAAGLILDLVFVSIASSMDSMYDLDYGGIILASALLEPAAGIVVAFFNTFVWAVFYEDPINVLYMGSSVVLALFTSLLFWRTGTSRAKRVGLYAVMTILMTALDYIGSFTSNFGQQLDQAVELCIASGVTSDAAVALGIVLFLYWLTMMVVIAAWYFVAWGVRKLVLSGSPLLRELGSGGLGKHEANSSGFGESDARVFGASSRYRRDVPPLPSQTTQRRINHRSRYR